MSLMMEATEILMTVHEMTGLKDAMQNDPNRVSGIKSRSILVSEFQLLWELYNLFRM